MNVNQLPFEVAETATGHRRLEPTWARNPPARSASVRRHGQRCGRPCRTRPDRRSPVSHPSAVTAECLAKVAIFAARRSIYGTARSDRPAMPKWWAMVEKKMGALRSAVRGRLSPRAGFPVRAWRRDSTHACSGVPYLADDLDVSKHSVTGMAAGFP